jgi:hypothetical protein
MDINCEDLGIEELNALREKYAYGTRVVLLYKEDDRLPVGIKGTVYGVDTRGFLVGRWDNGLELFLQFDDDEVQILEHKICPVCFKEYEGRDAISKSDGKTHICLTCANRENILMSGIDLEHEKALNTHIFDNSKKGSTDGWVTLKLAQKE